MRGARWCVGTMAVLVALGTTACKEQRLDESLDLPATTSTTLVPGASVPSTTTLGAAFVAKVAAVDAGGLKLGAAFNRQFLRLQFLAIGLDDTESSCAADAIAAAAGDEFAQRAVNQVMSGVGITPEVLMPCVSTQRLMDLAGVGGTADLGKIPPDVLRSTLTELATAGYETVGLTSLEAVCLADRVVGTYSDADLQAVMGQLSLPADRAAQALPSCATAERVNQLGG